MLEKYVNNKITGQEFISWLDGFYNYPPNEIQRYTTSISSSFFITLVNQIQVSDAAYVDLKDEDINKTYNKTQQLINVFSSPQVQLIFKNMATANLLKYPEDLLKKLINTTTQSVAFNNLLIGNATHISSQMIAASKISKLIDAMYMHDDNYKKSILAKCNCIAAWPINSGSQAYDILYCCLDINARLKNKYYFSKDEEYLQSYSTITTAIFLLVLKKFGNQTFNLLFKQALERQDPYEQMPDLCRLNVEQAIVQKEKDLLDNSTPESLNVNKKIIKI